jgi:hypothetical protein
MNRLVACTFVILLFIAGAARPAPAQGVDPKADAVLRDMGRALTSAKAFSFEASETIDQVSPTGQKIQLAKAAKISLRRPNAIAAVVAGDMEDLAYYYRGKTLTIVNNLERAYAQQDVPDNIDAMFDFLAEKFRLTTPLSDLLFADPYKALIEHARSGEYLGLHQVNGTKCHHLAFRQDAIDWQIWVEEGSRALPRKVVITYKDLPASPQFVAVLDKWELSGQVPDSAFEAKIPQGAKRIDLQPVDAPATRPISGAGAGAGAGGGEQR